MTPVLPDAERLMELAQAWVEAALDYERADDPDAEVEKFHELKEAKAAFREALFAPTKPRLPHGTCCSSRWGKPCDCARAFDTVPQDHPDAGAMAEADDRLALHMLCELEHERLTNAPLFAKRTVKQQLAILADAKAALDRLTRREAAGFGRALLGEK